jgi:hypothetical protein
VKSRRNEIEIIMSIRRLTNNFERSGHRKQEEKCEQMTCEEKGWMAESTCLTQELNLGPAAW